MRVLVLDDDDARHDGFRMWLIGAEAVHVHTAAQARDMLRGDRFDIVCLDRDLDLVSTMGGEGEETGEDVAEYIRLHLPREKHPGHVLIHSWNAPGALRMARDIASVGIPHTRQPYGLGLGMVLARIALALETA